jgi:hypothetical protein
MQEINETQAPSLIHAPETESNSFLDALETFLYENGIAIVLTSTGLMLALTIYITCSV